MAKYIPPEQIEIKPNFEQRYRQLLGSNYDEFIRASLSFLTRAIRVNTLKTSVQELKSRLEEKGYQLRQIPWCKEGFWIEHERRDLGNLLEHKIGYFYVQEAASMIPPIVLSPKQDEIILDMAAAPGSKTTQIAMYMLNTGLIVANDPDYKRLSALGLNLQRSGVTNTVITAIDGTRIRGEFDRILLDAPCTGTGTIRKSLKTLRKWNPRSIKKLSVLQKKLIVNAFNNLREQGVLVYSTCSLEPEENEEVVDYLLNKFDNVKIEPIDLELKRSSPVLFFEGKEYSKELKNVLRIYPHDNDTEGFFVAKIRKLGKR